MKAIEKNTTRNNMPERLDKGTCNRTNKPIIPQKIIFSLGESADLANRREIIMASDKKTVR